MLVQKELGLAVVPAGLTEDRLSVPGTQQAESPGRGCFLDFAATSLLPTLLKLSHGLAVLSHGDQLRHQQAHHAVQKTTGLDLDNHQVAATIKLNLLHGGSGMGAAAAGAHERAEVVETQKSTQGASHALFIKTVVIAMPRPRAQEQIGSSSVMDDVAIAAVDRVVAGMPVIGPGNGFAHPDRSRQASIQCRSPFFSRNRPAAIEVHDLTSSVNAGIGAASGETLNRSMRIQLLDRVLKNRLDTATIALPLPSAEISPVVLKAQGDPAKDRNL